MEEHRIERVRRVGDRSVEMLARMKVEVPRRGLIAGPSGSPFPQGMDPKAFAMERAALGADNRHYPMNASFLEIGFAGVVEEATRVKSGLGQEQEACRTAISRVYAEAIRYIGRHAELARSLAEAANGPERERLEMIAATCHALTVGPPRSFFEAVQLYWFAWRIRSASWSSSVGRLDQHLYPAYARDRQAGALCREDAMSILCELWEKFNEAGMGDTLKNVMLGGQDRLGRDATNELSYMMLEASLQVQKPEPHVAVRLHAATPPAFWDKTMELILLGHGQGTVYNDDLLIGSLVDHGVSLESARNYANDGCTELVIDGESGIFFDQMEATKSLELTLFNGEENPLVGVTQGHKWSRHFPQRELRTRLRMGFRSGDVQQMGGFAELYDAFLRQYLYQTDRFLDRVVEQIQSDRASAVHSPFLAGTFPVCRQDGVDPFRGGFTVDCYMLLSGGIPTVADGLAAIQKVVFEDGACTMAELLRALRANFGGFEPLRRSLLAAPKFGNDIDAVDRIAADIAERFCERVRGRPTPNGKPIWPGLYDIDFNDFAKTVGATPDGRRWMEPLAEHYSPTPGRARRGPTAVVRSATKGPLAKGCGGSPFHLSLSRSSVPRTEEGRRLISDLVRTSLRLGAAVLNVAIYDAEVLRKAKIEPERYADVVVRVWGFSARFVDLSEDLQDHIIARVIQGA